LRLNRRLCPDIYELVIELRETEAGAAFDGNGNIIDYAVMMKRLPMEGMLDRVIDSGNISTGEIRTIARKIAEFHSKAATSAHIAEFGSMEQIKFNWRENFEQTLQFQASTLPLNVRNNIKSFIETFSDSHSVLLKRRIERGFIRECDGDIHLGNICLLNGRAYIFDCIEFNERFRYSDTAADIAFMLMDLDYHGRQDLAEAALAAYIEESGDTDCALLIPFYKVYRAFVRGKVESLELLDTGINEKDRAAAQKRAIRYFRLAQGYCLRSHLPPTLFITCGTMGCGKSTVAGQLAFELGVASYNSDVIRKQLAGIPLKSAVKVSFGEGLYSKEMSMATYRELERLAETELASGKSVVIDAAFGTAQERLEFATLAASHHAGFVILYVHCTPDVQRERLRIRSFLATSISDGRIDLLEQHERFFEAPDKSEGSVMICSSNGSPEQSLNALYERLFQL
jgi:aminoglycoside phosphotransferase family enzyme/predicted kinase